MHVTELVFFLSPHEKAALGRAAFSETGVAGNSRDARAKLK